MNRVFCAAIAATLTLATAAQRAAASEDVTPPVTAYVGATMLDGTGAEPIENATLLVQGQRILSSGSIAPPDGAEIIDVSGKWIVPGLIDAHIHFMVSGRLYTRPSFLDLTHLVPYEEEVAFIQRQVPVTLRSLLCSGVTSAVSAGGPSIEYQARAQAEAMPDAPTLFVSHGPIGLVPEFMIQSFFPLFDGEPSLKSARSAEAGEALVREGVAMDADLIKTVYDASGSLMRKFLQWDYKSVHEGIVAEATRHNLKVTSHSHELEPARALAEIGVASLQHIPVDAPVDDEFIALLNEKEVILVPTLALRQRTFVEALNQDIDFLPIETRCGDPEVIKSLFEVEEMPDLGSARIQTVVDGSALAAENTKSLHDGGVTLAVGTDAGNYGMLHGPSMHLELIRMSEAGIPAADLIVAATLNSARVAGKDDHYGSIESGKFADFLVLSDNPLDDIAHLQAIELVVKHGQAFTQAELTPSQPTAGLN